ncbi:hypothetical protein N9L18_00780 [Candidatus Pacebacteria bacterium]|nr:hypothetical protein [Candidatus Paceibacterota bacterium]
MNANNLGSHNGQTHNPTPESNTMKATAITLLSLLLFFFVGMARKTKAEETLTLETHLVPYYLGDLFGIQVNDEYTTQSSANFRFDISEDAAMSIGGWWSIPLDGKKNDWGYEIDYSAFYYHSLGEWDIFLGSIYYNLLEGKQVQFQTGVSRSFDSWTTALTVYHSEPLTGLSFEGGTHVSFRVSKGIKITERMRLNVNTSLFYDSGVFGLDDGVFLQFTPRMLYDITDSLQFEAGLNVHLPITTNDDRYPDAGWTIGLRKVF